MYTEDIGENIRTLRELRRMTRSILAERAGVSLSHLEKIENGLRSPGMPTYKRIMEVLNEEQTVQQKCAVKVQNILLSSSEEKAVFLTKVLEYMADNMEKVV